MSVNKINNLKTSLNSVKLIEGYTIYYSLLAVIKRIKQKWKIFFNLNRFIANLYELCFLDFKIKFEIKYNPDAFMN